jgi:hypothetical protein
MFEQLPPEPELFQAVTPGKLAGGTDCMNVVVVEVTRPPEHVVARGLLVVDVGIICWRNAPL